MFFRVRSFFREGGGREFGSGLTGSMRAASRVVKEGFGVRMLHSGRIVAEHTYLGFRLRRKKDTG